MSDQVASIKRVQELLDRLERSRARLDDVDGEQAVEVLRELSDLARDVQAEIERARRAGVRSDPKEGETGADPA